MIITFYRVNEEGITYYYSIHDRQGNLFSPYSFTVVWGSDFREGRTKVYTFDSREEMDMELRKMCRERINLGYKVLYSFFRDSDREKELFDSGTGTG